MDGCSARGMRTLVALFSGADIVVLVLSPASSLQPDSLAVPAIPFHFHVFALAQNSKSVSVEKYMVYWSLVCVTAILCPLSHTKNIPYSEPRGSGFTNSVARENPIAFSFASVVIFFFGNFVGEFIPAPPFEHLET